MKSRWIFIGEDGSMGFKTSQTYEIFISVSSSRISIHYHCPTGEVLCPYASWKAFFKNWQLAS